MSNQKVEFVNVRYVTADRGIESEYAGVILFLNVLHAFYHSPLTF